MVRRVIYVVLDGVGVGALPDAHDYGDEDSDTLGNVSRIIPLELPFLQRLGLGNVAPLKGVPPVARTSALVGRLAPRSVGKDTTVGHWEQMGLITSHPFPTYPDGFPPEIIGAFSRRIGRDVLGNCAASGTEIINKLGDEHRATGKPIVYTSADSVFQIAAHADEVPLHVLYEWCQIARDLLVGPHAVARVIARPFTGGSGHYVRTSDRRDFSLPPPGPTYLDLLGPRGVRVVGVGKIGEIFSQRGIDSNIKVSTNEENLAVLEEFARQKGSVDGADCTLVFSNLVDFDSVWGHRNDVEGFAQGLKAADAGLALVAEALGPEDRLVITADHGVDPTTPSTDHSREYVPMLLSPRPTGAPRSVYEGEFADAGAFVFEYLTGARAELAGRSLSRLAPSRGWSGYTARPSRGTAAEDTPPRVSRADAETAGDWLRRELGTAPDVAIVLGSGLSISSEGGTSRQVGFAQVPHWRDGAQLPGHPRTVSCVRLGDARCVVLQGRVHEYEGADLSEVQLPVRSLAAWGVRNIVLTTAAGGVAQGTSPGQTLFVGEVYDLQHRTLQGQPALLTATDESTTYEMSARAEHTLLGPSPAVHACVPGPQYETPAELDVLRAAGVETVSMSPAGELLAAIDEEMRTAVVAVVTNIGVATHGEVIEAGERTKDALTDVVSALCAVWT